MKSANHFRKTSQLTLPSGETVETRKVSMDLLILQDKTNSVPRPLRDYALKALNQELTDEERENGIQFRFDDETSSSYVNFVNLVTKAVLVWPKVVEANPDYEAGEIEIDDLDFTDRQFIFRHASTKAAPEPVEEIAADSFRAEQNSHVGTVPDGESLQSEAVGFLTPQ
jgi:hypothetical protein